MSYLLKIRLPFGYLSNAHVTEHVDGTGMSLSVMIISQRMTTEYLQPTMLRQCPHHIPHMGVTTGLSRGPSPHHQQNHSEPLSALTDTSITRLVAAALIPVTIAPFAGGSLNPVLDATFCALLIVHSHIGFQ